MSKKGIKDLLLNRSIKTKGLQEALLNEKLGGNWESIQNVYNLINGNVTPKDPYAYIFLAELLDESVRSIIMRYTNARAFVSHDDLF
jgi:hypothetical protein